jgi:uncharacterized protein (DUF2141 family)
MKAIVLAAAALSVTPPPQSCSTTIAVAGLRNAKGVIQVCMTRDPHHFPDCSGDPSALRKTVPASAPTAIFTNVAPGDYAVSVIHDENDNRKLDTALGIPREGFGFSRNPKIRFGAPRFKEVDIRIAPGFSRIDVHMQYLL